MGKQKELPRRSTMVRLPKSLHDRLVKISAERSIKAGRRIGVSSLIVEAVEQSLNAA